MSRTKHLRLRKVKEFPNVFLPGIRDETGVKVYRYFGNGFPISLEIGCGNGDYTIELAKANQQRNFIGIDLKGARIYNGAKIALEQNLHNAAFLLCRVEKLNEIFHNKSISEMFIPFPDPHVRRTSERRRLIAAEFLKMYSSLLSDSGKIHFKTDNDALYDYAIRSITAFGCKIFYMTENLYKHEMPNDIVPVQTKYEKSYLLEGREIKYISFGF